MRYYEEELETLIKAGAKVVEIASFEWQRVHGFVNYVAEDLNVDWYSWSSVSGLKVWENGNFKTINPDCVTLPAELDFSDERGDLNKLISFDDYLYIFRDYGITKLSIYSSDSEFSINHQYMSDSYIYPNSIAQSGDNVYFLERTGLKVFNGSSVNDVEIECIELIKACDQSKCWATSFNGKYYLACRCDFQDDKQIGCEGYTSGYINNALIVYDYQTEHIDIVRGVDINQVLALNNPLKAKLVACFNNQYKGKIGQLTRDGKLFGNALENLWQSTKNDLGYHGQKKRIKNITIKSLSDALLTIESESMARTYNITGKQNIQKIRTNVIGNEFSVKIEAQGEINISNIVLTASVIQ